jgi:hypothetical protein
MYIEARPIRASGILERGIEGKCEMVDLRAVENVSEKFETVEDLGKELKRVQSIKCRLKKQKGRKDYQDSMTEVLNYEEVLKEARQLLDPKTKSVTNFTQDDVDLLDYDETVKAIRSIQSKKTLTKWMTGIENDNDEYRNAVSIEAMLVSHRSIVKPVDEGHIRKSEVLTIIDTIEESGKLSQKKIVEMLRAIL